MGRSTTAALVGLVLLAAAGSGRAGERVYLSQADAWKRLAADADSVTIHRVHVTSALADTLRARSGLAAVDSAYAIREAWRGGRVVRRAVVVNAVGQYEPITILVTLDARSAVERVDVMVYREPRGSEVRRRAFLEQFEGATAAAPPRIGRGIRHVTGATISSRAVARAVRLALELSRRAASNADAPAFPASDRPEPDEDTTNENGRGGR